MNAPTLTDLRSRHLNRCVSDRDPRAALIAQDYRNCVTSNCNDFSARDSPTTFEVPRNDRDHSFPSFSADNSSTTNYFPANGPSTQKAILKVAKGALGEGNDAKILV